MPLVMLGVGIEAVVVKSFVRSEMKKRFEEIGLIPGTKVKILTEISGDIILLVKDTRLALNKGTAQKMIVKVA